MAAKAGQLSQIELLLVYGANISAVDSRSNTCVDYARQAGHMDLVHRLVEHQFTMSDALTRYVCRDKQPNHKIGEHFLLIDVKPEFLNFSSSENGNSSIMYRQELSKSIQSLSDKSFQELTRDIYDEMDRRETNAFIMSRYGNENGKLSSVHQQLILPFLPVYQFFTSTRNQERQKLALLNTKEFTLLIVDTLNEIRVRVYGITNAIMAKSLLNKYNNLDNDSEPLYDSVPSEGDYDDCNDNVTLPLKLSTLSNMFKDGASSKTLDYAAIKNEILASVKSEMNNSIRSEVSRLQTTIDKLVEENAQLKRVVIKSSLPSHNNSSNSLNKDPIRQSPSPQQAVKNNSVLIIDPIPDNHYVRNSMARDLEFLNRPQSMDNANVGLSDDVTPFKSSSIVHTLSQSPLHNNHQQPSSLDHHSGPQSTINSYSSQAPSHGQQPTPRWSNSVSQVSAANFSYDQQQPSSNVEYPQLNFQAIYNSFNQSKIQSTTNQPGNSTTLSTSNSNALQSSHKSNNNSLPTREQVINKIEFITDGIKELLCNAKEGKHDK